MNSQGVFSNCIDVSDIGLQIDAILNKRYKISSYMSLGNMTVVYKGFDCENNESVLIKELAPISLINRDLNQRDIVPKNRVCQDKLELLKGSFENEIEILKKLADKKYGLTGNVPGYKDHFYENNTVYLITTYYEGRDLQKRIEDREELSFCDISRKIVAVVEKVHRAGIIHRDIKLSNIFIRNDGEIVLLDFGSACDMKDDLTAARYVSNGFSPPELYEEKESTLWVDIFTIGAALYQMLTGVRPVQYNARNEMYIVDIGEYVNIPCVLAWAIMKMLELKKDKRLKKLWVIKMLL